MINEQEPTRMTRTSLIILAIIAIASVARAQEVRYMPEPDFESMVRHFAAPTPKDAFGGLAECGVLDAKTFAPVTLAKAEQMLQPCAKAVGARYAANVAIERMSEPPAGTMSTQVEGLAIYLPATVTVTDALMRDMQNALHKRGDRVLGYMTVIRRGEPPSADKKLKALADGSSSRLQQSVDSCIQPMVVRKIESSEDFILYYGKCIVKDSALKVRELRPSAGHPLSVTLVSLADTPTVRSLNGAVTVNAENGPVTVSVLAYPETVYLP